LKHSGLGIAGLVAASLAVALLVAGMAVVVLTQVGVLVETPGIRVVGGGAGLASLCVGLLALGLSIGGLLQRDRRRVYAVVATVMSVTVVVCMGALMVIGATLAAAQGHV
jgi:hypothetical protein